MMRTVAEDMREDMIENIGREIINGVPLGRTETADSMAPSPSPVEERPTKNRPSNHIRCRTKTAEMGSRLDYRTQDFSGR